MVHCVCSRVVGNGLEANCILVYCGTQCFVLGALLADCHLLVSKMQEVSKRGITHVCFERLQYCMVCMGAPYFVQSQHLLDVCVPRAMLLCRAACVRVFQRAFSLS